jgi:hypothetical protein
VNPNHLLKDELRYELGIRGISSNADTQSLRNLFRSVASRALTLQFSDLTSLCVEELYSSVTIKISELQSLVTQLAPSLALVVPRVRTKLLHLRSHVI